MRGVDDRAAGTEVTEWSIRFMDFQRDRKARPPERRVSTLGARRIRRGMGVHPCSSGGSTRWGVRLVRVSRVHSLPTWVLDKIECVTEFYWGSWRSSPCECLLLEGSADLGNWLKVSLRIEAAWFLSGQEEVEFAHQMMHPDVVPRVETAKSSRSSWCPWSLIRSRGVRFKEGRRVDVGEAFRFPVVLLCFPEVQRWRGPKDWVGYVVQHIGHLLSVLTAERTVALCLCFQVATTGQSW